MSRDAIPTLSSMANSTTSCTVTRGGVPALPCTSASVCTRRASLTYAGAKFAHIPSFIPAATTAARSSARSPSASACCFFLGLRFVPGGGERQGGPSGARYVDLRPAATSFVALAGSWEDKATLCPSGKMLVRHTARAELPHALLRDTRTLPFDDENDALAIARW